MSSSSCSSTISDHSTFLQLHSFSHQPRFRSTRRLSQIDPLLRKNRTRPHPLGRGLVARACVGPAGGGRWKEKGKVALDLAVGRFSRAIAAVPVVVAVNKRIGSNYAIGLLSLALTILVITVRKFMAGKARQNYNGSGSVAELVRRGQLRSDRRGISKPILCEDPFNNPLVKKGKSNTVEVCGKVYRLAPVILTEEQQSSHQKRRSRAYKWKRPTIYLKEGEDIPPDVDPDTVQWVPTNHPFATTVSDIDEKLAQNNVFQKDGVPFRIRAEHEELQRKLEALQNEQKLDNMAITPNSLRAFERQSDSTLKQPNSLAPDISQKFDGVDSSSSSSNLLDKAKES